MSREILFRGKRADSGEWVYGSPIFQDSYVLIRFWNSEEFEFQEYLVAPETVGQYTGLKDKKGKRIFEGDIVSTEIHDGQRYEQIVGVITYVEEHMAFAIWHLDENVCDIIDSLHNKLEIVGTIHDNPELLKENKR